VAGVFNPNLGRPSKFEIRAFHPYITEADIWPLPNPKNIVFFQIVTEFLPKMQDIIFQNL
jgi:hypothetical protein